jgi:general nucleoside transport system permease protein
MDWERILTLTFAIQVMAAGLRMGMPLIIASLGEIYAERSGVFNLGVEGIMLFGAFTGFAAAFLSGSMWVGVLASLALGALMGLIFSYWVITLQADQIVVGYSMLIVCSGAAIFFYRMVFPSTLTMFVPMLDPFPAIAIPVLSEIPFIGPIIFKQDALVYLTFLLVIISSIILFRTRYGLRVSAVGEYPSAADSVGINVNRVRYVSTIIGSALAGMGGAYFSLVVLGLYSDTMIAGRGFIALALVIFGRWNPYWVLAGGFLFGIIDALQLRLQFLGAGLPVEFLVMLPYVLTIFILLVGKKRMPPSALTIPYSRE